MSIRYLVQEETSKGKWFTLSNHRDEASAVLRRDKWRKLYPGSVYRTKYILTLKEAIEARRAISHRIQEDEAVPANEYKKACEVAEAAIKAMREAVDAIKGKADTLRLEIEALHESAPAGEVSFSLNDAAGWFHELQDCLTAADSELERLEG